MKKMSSSLFAAVDTNARQHIIPIQAIVAAALRPDVIPRHRKVMPPHIIKYWSGKILGGSWSIRIRDIAAEPFVFGYSPLETNCETVVWTRHFGTFAVHGNHTEKILDWRPDYHLFSVRQHALVLPERPYFMGAEAGKNKNSVVAHIYPYGTVEFEDVDDKPALIDELVKKYAINK